MKSVKSSEGYRSDFDLGLSLRESQNKHSEKDAFERQMIQTSLKNSYIYKMSGSKKEITFQNKDSQLVKSSFKSLLKNNHLKDIEKIDQEDEEDIQTYFFVSNIGHDTNHTTGCCTFQDSTACTIEITHQKQTFMKSKDTNLLMYSLNFNTISATLKTSIESQGYFIIIINQKLILKVENSEKKKNLTTIYHSLANSIRSGLGKEYNMQDLPQTNLSFYKSKYKPAIQFLQHCQTGDILLFQGSHFFANIQRFFTNSDYDHVGMVIKDPIYGILIFESNSSSGVSLTPFQLIIKYKWFESIPRIVWRKLKDIQRGFKFEDLIHKFVLANIGKGYYISINKLLSNKSFIAGKAEQVGFFCSELVAAIYKDLGILTRDQSHPNFKPGCNFIPYHFTEKYNLKLEQGKLSEQFLIHFHEKSLGDHLKN